MEPISLSACRFCQGRHPDRSVHHGSWWPASALLRRRTRKRASTAMLRVPHAAKVAGPSARLTGQHLCPSRSSHSILEKRLLCLRITVWAYPVQWFTTLVRFFQGSSPDLRMFVYFLLLLPVLSS